MPISNLNRKLQKLDRGSLNRRSDKRKRIIKILIALGVLLLITYFPARGVYQSAKQLNTSAKGLSAAVKQNNFDLIKSELTNTKKAADSLNGSLNWLFWLRIIPIVGGYYSDGKHLALAATYDLEAAQKIVEGLEPHKAELGLLGQPIAGQDRISQAVKILDKALPDIQKVEPLLGKARKEAEAIDTNKYPEKFAGRSVKSLVEGGKGMIIGAHMAVSEHKDALEVAPSALGLRGSKTYLMLFQNDKELRATGGFLTAFAALKLENGHLATTASDDIYRLDERLLRVCLNKICPLTPPAPIVKYLPEANGKPRTAWSMRDSNLSPDLPTSAAQFESMFQLLGEGLPFDGIIYIDSQVVEELIAVTGPIKVFDTTYSAETDKRCNCPNVIYELEHYAEIASKGEADRKAVLGTLMQSLLGQILGAPPEKMPEFINVIVKLANHKHVMLYMHDTKAQQAVSKLGWTGEIKTPTGDYLHINDSNFAGGKSNLYVEERVTLDINPDTGLHKLTIDYKNPQPFNVWLNGILRDYVRVYLPEGAKLISNKGSDDPVNTLEDEKLNKTYLDAFVTVRPQNSRKLELEYEAPVKLEDGKVKLLIQKQPGAKDHHYTIKIKGSTKAEFELTADKELTF
jgi:hypothetical protein